MARREGTAAIDCQCHVVGQCLKTCGCGCWCSYLVPLYALLDLCQRPAGSTKKVRAIRKSSALTRSGMPCVCRVGTIERLGRSPEPPGTRTRHTQGMPLRDV